MWNNLKTVLLLGAMSGLVLAAGSMFGRGGLQIALVMALGMNLLAFFFSEKIALMSSGALPVTPEENSDVYYRIAPMTDRLCQAMGLPMPRLWVIPDEAPNAFATGRSPSHSSVAVTYGLLQLMDDDELEAVIGHELGHISHRDILISSVAAALASALSYMAQMAFFFGGSRDDEEGGGSPFAPIVAFVLAIIGAPLIQMAISRSREFAADAAAARFTGSKYKMINALRKLEAYSQRIPMAHANPGMSHMYIIKPLNGGTMMKLFSTHPPTQDRIAALQALAQ